MNQNTTNATRSLQSLEDLWPRLYKGGCNMILASLIALGGGHRGSVGYSGHGIGSADATIRVVECYSDFLHTYFTYNSGPLSQERYIERSRDLINGVRECVDENSDLYWSLGLRLINSALD
ncbi:MAG: hypothetical protein Q8R04_07540 [Nanoarchaeota archaeon]|nr:hypothetical protein [Nanoarchaeota archaeon]